MLGCGAESDPDSLQLILIKCISGGQYDNIHWCLSTVVMDGRLLLVTSSNWDEWSGFVGLVCLIFQIMLVISK